MAVPWGQFARQLPHALFSLLYPGDCRICARPLLRFSRVPVCEECIEAVHPLAPGAQCQRCGLPFENAAPLHRGALCGLCRRGAVEFDWGRGFGVYEGNLRHLIHLFKYGGMRPLARPLGTRLAAFLAEAGPVDLIVPVPLHGRRQRSRGFNQAELLAAELSRAAGIPMQAALLCRRRPTESQTGLTHRQRRENVRGAFEVRRPAAVAGKRVALVDDVVTTGATAGACTRALKQAGASRVVVLAMARARQRLVDMSVRPRAAAVGV